MNNIMLSEIAANGGGIVSQLFNVLMIAVCIGIVWALGRWIFMAFEAKPIVFKVWNALFLIVGAIFVINFLLSLAGVHVIRW